MNREDQQVRRACCGYVSTMGRRATARRWTASTIQHAYVHQCFICAAPVFELRRPSASQNFATGSTSMASQSWALTRHADQNTFCQMLAESCQRTST
jgi:hypothetical protein